MTYWCMVKNVFLLHYNFPPFSTGEAKAQRGVGRREIGHGNLAHRALKGMIPQTILMLFGWFRIFSNPMVLRPWQPSAQEPWH